MSITDELRECATDWGRNLIGRGGKAVLFNIADRIDIEHKKAVDIAFTNGRTEGIADGCAYYDTEHTECMLSEEHGWIRLPKDANGEYIHIGDMMENLREDLEPPFHHTFRVYGIQYRAYGQECTLTEDGYPSNQYRASEVRHYHEPTVEDVLAEFALEIDPSADIAVTGAETIKKFAAKLQLKEPNE